MPLKVVFDTNIVISAIVFGGSPRLCLDMARVGQIKLYTSIVLLLELAEKLNKKFAWNADEIEEVIVGIAKFAKVVEVNWVVNRIKADLSDNRVLEVAKQVGADLIISGDKKHILPLKQFGGTEIVSAADFLKKFI